MYRYADMMFFFIGVPVFLFQILYCIAAILRYGTPRFDGMPTVYCHSGAYWPFRYFGMVRGIGCIATGSDYFEIFLGDLLP